MAVYNYRAKNLKGEEEDGTIEAADEHQLAEILKRKGYFLVSVDSGEKSKKKKKDILKGFNLIEKIMGVSLSEKLFFTKNLEVMIRTGVPLPRGFSILSRQTKSKKLKNALNVISAKIIKGDSLSSALGDFPDIFSSLYRETLKVGEETGKLEDSLRTLSNQMEKEHKLKSSIQTAMVYPAVVLVMAFLIGILMMVFAVPKLKEAFTDMDIALPITTRAVLGFADFLTQRWYLAIIVLPALLVAFVFAYRSKKFSKPKSFLFVRLPIIAKIVKKTNSAMTMRMLSSLLKAGVPVVRALEIASGALSNYYFKKSLAESAQFVEKGKKISDALKPYEKLYSSMVLQMMEVGEETGETSDILAKLADFYEEEVASATEKLSAVIEPVLILFIGGIVGIFAISMMQPMFSILGGI